MRDPTGFKVKLALAAATLLSPAVGLAPAAAAPPRSTAASEPGGKPGPAPINERFPNLDAYLAYLEQRSRMDGPWYRQVRPGVYELQTGNLRLPDGGRGKRVYTREELERKFGFAR